MEDGEWRFAMTISGAHGVDHLLKRVFPPLVPVWAVAFGFPLWKLGLLIGARSFGSALGQAPMGHLSDRFDRRRMLPAGIALMGLGFVAFAALPGVPALDAAVTVAGLRVSGEFVAMVLVMITIGLGSSTLHPVGYPLISRNVGPERKGKVLGMWGSARAFGDGGAPALVGAALLVAGWKLILVGFGLLGLAYAGYLFVALGDFETRPAGDAATGSDAEAAGLLSGDRRRYLYPMLAVFAAFTLQIVATTGANVFLPEFVASEYGYAVTLGGVTVIPEATASFYYSALLLTAGVVQLGTGELVDRYDHRAVLVGFLVAAAGVLLVVATVQFSPLGLLAILLLLGATLWGLNPARDAIVADITPPEREGRTFGYLWTGALLVASLAPAVVGYVGDVAGLRLAFAVLAGVVLLSAVPVAALFSGRVYHEATPPDAVADD